MSIFIDEKQKLLSRASLEMADSIQKK